MHTTFSISLDIKARLEIDLYLFGSLDGNSGFLRRGFTWAL